ncbi:MAG: hypothetical protein IPK86_01305 [Neisseriales bacterium]|nr:MAG: hypothetical protein IPK86_01305 [Neisseriales bacterium]
MKQSLLVAALLAIALTGCAGKQSDTASSEVASDPLNQEASSIEEASEASAAE